MTSPLIALIPLLPFAGFVVNATMGKRLPKSVSGGLASLVMLASFAVAATLVWQLAGLAPDGRLITQTIYRWMSSGEFTLDVTLLVDPLSAVMLLVITGIGSLIHIYSTAYMHDEVDSEFARYFSYLNLFAAFMLVLVLGSSLPVLFVGWEGVGLCSYLLIGFWFKKKSAADAGKKAFVVNRIGDYAFLLGMFALFAMFGTLEMRGIAAAVAAQPVEAGFGVLSIVRSVEALIAAVALAPAVTTAAAPASITTPVWMSTVALALAYATPMLKRLPDAAPLASAPAVA